MKLHKLATICSCLLFAVAGYAQQTQNADDVKYRRSSLYTLMINHTDQKYADEIRRVFVSIPTPDKFNDHDLSVKVINLDKKLKGAKSDDENQAITTFLDENQVASRMVAKWFNRDYFTGACDMELVKERGLYNATKFDAILAERSQRGQALLADAGEELIGNTFVVVNDIRYIDKEKRGKVIGGVLRGLGAIASAAMGSSDNMFDSFADMAESLKGFKVKINSFLYRLEWNDDIAVNFYKTQYAMGDNDTAKRDAFNNARGSYRLVYVGKQESSGSNTSFMGVNLDDPVMMVRKACQRALDENVAALQHSHEEFRTLTPITTTQPLTAYVGMKEGIDTDTRFEVLETIENEDGTRTYKRVGVVKPVKNLIWDNRYMALEEGAEGAGLGATTFTHVSGTTEYYPGMMLREITSK